MVVDIFPTPHDAAEPVGFAFRQGQLRFSHVTDIGHLSPAVEEALRGSQALLVESNHDVDMLREGPYPDSLKQRVGSRLGHLSNEALAVYLEQRLPMSVRHLFLAHISRTNNHESLALSTCRKRLKDGAIPSHGPPHLPRSTHAPPSAPGSSTGRSQQSTTGPRILNAGGAAMLTDRYTHPEMGALWSEQKKFETWLAVEIAAAEAMAAEDIVPAEAVKEIKKKASFSIERIDAIERDVNTTSLPLPPRSRRRWAKPAVGSTSASPAPTWSIPRSD